jgi:hypothetical protein
MSISTSPDSPSTLVLPERLPRPLPTESQLFTLQHLALLHHVERHMMDCLMHDLLMMPIISKSIDYALNAPYLMDVLLALSALHLGHLHPERAEYYHHQATELQTRALVLFNSEKDDISESNCLPKFLFSAFIGLHVLSDTLTRHRDNFSVFLDSFVDYLHLHRGVRAVIGSQWEVIEKQGLKAFSEVTAAVRQQTTAGEETQELNRLLDSADLGPATMTACKTALECLQMSMNLYRFLGEPPGRRIHATMAWPVLVPLEYVKILKQRRPEALVILAYYGVMMHRSREFWILNDAGRWLIDSITAHLGDYWEEWLLWPNRVLAEEPGV